MAQELLNESNAQSLYYGRFITKYNDHAICGPCFTPYIAPPKTTNEAEIPLDEDALKKQLMEACEDYDKIEVIADQPMKKKRKTSKRDDKKTKKTKR